MPAARSRSSLTASCALANALSTSSRRRPGRREALARELELDHQRDEPLLGAVVEVAAEPPALGVARLDDPGARGPQRLQPRPQLDLQARVLDRQRGGRGGSRSSSGDSHSARVVDERADVARPRGRRGPSRAPAAGRPSRSTYSAVRASRRPAASGRPAPSASASRTLRGSTASRSITRPTVGGVEEARAHEPEQERRGHQREARRRTRSAAPRGPLADRHGDEVRDTEREDHRAQQQHGLQAAALDGARSADGGRSSDDDGASRSPIAPSATCRTPRIAASTAIVGHQPRVAARASSVHGVTSSRAPAARRRRSRRRRSGGPRGPPGPAGKASSRWTSAEMATVSKQRADREQPGVSRNCRPSARRARRRCHQHAGRVLRAARHANVPTPRTRTRRRRRCRDRDPARAAVTPTPRSAGRR